MPESLTVLIRQPSLYSLHDLTDNYPRVDLWLPVHGGSCASARLDVQELDNPQVVCGKCNETHTVTYTIGTAAQELALRPDFVLFDTVHVKADRHTNGEGALAVSHGSHSIFWMREPAPHMNFTELGESRGFAGYASFHQAADFFTPRVCAENLAMDYRHAASGATIEQRQQQRTSIGIWHTNCDSKWRNPIMDALIASGLDVRSYGRCKNNMPINEEKPATLDNEDGLRLCQHHRLILAVENFACEDWITQNIRHAVVCGAIPIVATRGGVPDYDAIVGKLPRIDAGQAGWLDEVRAVMTNDTHYALYLTATKKWANPRHGTWQEHARHASGHSPHCAWFDALRLARPKELRWPGCLNP